MNLEFPDIPDLHIIPWKDVDIQWRKSIQDNLLSTQSPYYLIFPETSKALSTVIEFAYRSAWKVLVCGNGSKLSWGGLVREAQVVISTQRLNRIIDHAIGDLTVTVEAGITIAELQQALSSSNQFLPINPCYPQSATIGGIVATADTGSWRQRYGGIRDLLLGLSFVRADGVIAKAGGRVVKNVAGYDLMKLFCGSFGTLGMITQVTMRLYPLPEASTTLILQGSSKKIEEFAQAIRQSRLTPTAAEAVSTSLLTKLDFGKTEGILIRFQGMPQSIDEQKRQASQIAKNLALNFSDSQSEKEIDIWQNMMELVRQSNTEQAIVGKIGIIPSKIAQLMAKIDLLLGDIAKTSINITTGLGYIQINQDISIEKLQQLRQYCQDNFGYLIILESPVSIRQRLIPRDYNRDVKNLMIKIRDKFDEKQIFNPAVLSF